MMGRSPALVWVPMAAAVLIGVVALTGGDPDAQQAGVCVDERSGNRLDDDACGDWDDEGHASTSGTYFMWVSTSSAHQVPAKGAYVPSYIGSRTVPKGTPVAKGLPATGGSMSTIQRGGFGAKAGVSAGSKGGTSGGS